VKCHDNKAGKRGNLKDELRTWHRETEGAGALNTWITSHTRTLRAFSKVGLNE
jgi:hypothetical protein